MMELWEEIKTTKIYLILRAMIIYPIFFFHNIVYSIIYDPSALLENPSSRSKRKRKRSRNKAKQPFLSLVTKGFRAILAIFLSMVFLVLYIQYLILMSFIMLLLFLGLVYVIFHKISFRTQQYLDEPLKKIRSW